MKPDSWQTCSTTPAVPEDICLGVRGNDNGLKSAAGHTLWEKLTSGSRGKCGASRPRIPENLHKISRKGNPLAHLLPSAPLPLHFAAFCKRLEAFDRQAGVLDQPGEVD